MITQFSCSCGNNKPSNAMYYDGAMGYEAIVCKECGRYSDHSGEYEADDWSKQFITHTSDIRKLLPLNNIDLNKVNLLNFIK